MRSLLQLCHSPPALAVAVLLFAFALGTPRAASPAASAAQGDFAGFVDIGSGRRLYLECRGTGSPVVVLEAGYRSAARIWSEDLHQPGAPRTMVLAGVAVFTRVCAYDRPGTVAALNDNVRQSRSDPVPMPRTALDVVADLHALLRAAGVPAPYVFAGHSLGGLFVRLYASTYPRDVFGLVLVDAYSEMLETLLTPERWAALVRLNVRSGSDTVEPVPSYGDLETIGYGKITPRCARRPRARHLARCHWLFSPMPVRSTCRRRRRGSRRTHWNPSCVRRTKTLRRSSRTHASSWPKTAAMISTKINQSW